MSNVVAFKPKPRVTTSTSPNFDEAWSRYPDTGRLRSSRRQAWPEWCDVSREIGEEVLVAAVIRYAAEDKDHKRECGAPGFHRWLKQGRWEHWTGAKATRSVGRQFPDDHIRSSVVAATSDAFVVSYLDPCEVEGTTLIVRTEYAMEKLKEMAALFRSLGFTGMRKRAL